MFIAPLDSYIPRRVSPCWLRITFVLQIPPASMAPTAVYESHLLKRSSSQANFDTPAAKKLNRGSPRHHKPTWDLQWSQRQDASFQDEQSIHSLLTRSIGLALETVGYEAAAPEAVESFSADVEECMKDIARALAVFLC